jgi:hypothetical protein
MPTKAQKDPSLMNVTRAELDQALEPYPTIQGTVNFVNKVVPGMMTDLLDSDAFSERVLAIVTKHANERIRAETGERASGIVLLGEG